MTDWTGIVASEFPKRFEKPDWRPISQPGVGPERLHALEKELGVTLPNELHRLYAAANGLGLEGRGPLKITLWLVKPIDELPQFIASTRKWFCATHEAEASNFFPFIDWSNGDATGYLRTLDSDLNNDLYIFEHELYTPREGQPTSEFLHLIDESIEQHLLQMR